MRQLKFRAWDNVDNRMIYAGEDIDICFTLGSAGIECVDLNKVSPSGDGIDSMEHLIYMQYTGLKDSVDKVIYEGDIVEDFIWNKRYEVIWDSYAGMFLFNPVGIDCSGIDYYEFEDVTSRSSTIVIGNKYENPNYLKVKEMEK